MTRSLVPLALALALAGAAGCADRLHLTPGHGRAVQTSIARQQVNPEAGKKPRPLPSLDAQEAAAVASNYRHSLVAKDTQVREQGGLVLVAPPANNGQPYVPPPSVPEQK